MSRGNTPHVCINLDQDECHMGSNQLRLRERMLSSGTGKGKEFEEMSAYFGAFFSPVWAGTMFEKQQESVWDGGKQREQRVFTKSTRQWLGGCSQCVSTDRLTYFPLWFTLRLKLQRQLIENLLLISSCYRDLDTFIYPCNIQLRKIVKYFSELALSIFFTHMIICLFFLSPS